MKKNLNLQIVILTLMLVGDSIAEPPCFLEYWPLLLLAIGVMVANLAERVHLCHTTVAEIEYHHIVIVVVKQRTILSFIAPVGKSSVVGCPSHNLCYLVFGHTRPYADRLIGNR